MQGMMPEQFDPACVSSASPFLDGTRGPCRTRIECHPCTTPECVERSRKHDFNLIPPIFPSRKAGKGQQGSGSPRATTATERAGRVRSQVVGSGSVGIVVHCMFSIRRTLNNPLNHRYGQGAGGVLAVSGRDRMRWFVAGALVLFAGPLGAAPPSFRTLTGTHIEILTDLPADPETDQLPAAFDAAVPRWRDELKLSEEQVANWRVRAYVMRDKERFRAAGHLPEDLPDFPHGYQRGDQLWVVAQSGNYYTRHLLLHEGVHGLMTRVQQGAGAPWFMEGTAELWATHRWDGQGIKLPIIPASRNDTPYWGRLKLIDQARQKNRVPSIEHVLNYSRTAHRDTEPYAWSWAALLLLRMYPEYQPWIVDAARHGALDDRAFQRWVQETLLDDRALLESRWRLLVADLDYGFEPARHRWSPRVGTGLEELTPNSVQRTIKTDTGWQATGIRVAAGDVIEMVAEGRFSLADQPRPWWSEADGVTLRYYRGQPLGKLMALVLPEMTDRAVSRQTAEQSPAEHDLWENLEAVPVGSEGQVKAVSDGQLLLKVNDAPGALSDNRGTLQVTIRKAPASINASR